MTQRWVELPTSLNNMVKFNMNQLHPRELIKGNIYYECQSGFNIRFELVDEVKLNIKEDEKIYTWKGKAFDGTLIDYMHNDSYRAYTPRIYNTPQYMSIIDGVCYFKDDITGDIIKL